LLRTTARKAAATLSGSQIISISLLVMTGLSGSSLAVVASASLRIPMKLAADSDRSRPPIPMEASR
jgi:hypothetical protein